MSAFTTANTIFVCLELVSMIVNSLLVWKGGVIAIIPGTFGFLIILNLHNVTMRHIARAVSEASKGVGA